MKENLMEHLSAQYQINETNLRLRRQFIGLSPEDVHILRQLAGWADGVADQIAEEFYDHQFSFPPTRAFFKVYTENEDMPLAQLRQRLEKMQAGYFRQIFKEATAGGQYGTDYFEERLAVGQLHNVIDLPLKWYIGSYSLYQDLVRKHLFRRYFYRPFFRAKAERAIFTVFNYDIQAIAEAFFNDVLQSLGLDLAAVQVESAEHDVSDYYGPMKSYVRELTAAADRLAQGDLTVDITPQSDDDVLGNAFANLMAYLSDMASTADRVAQGDLSADITPRSDQDVLGNAFTQMTSYLQDIAGVADHIAQGDLSTDVTPQSDNDVLGNAFVQMIDNLRALIGQVQQSATQVASASQQINAASEQAAQATQQVAFTLASATAPTACSRRCWRQRACSISLRPNAAVLRGGWTLASGATTP